MAPGAPRPIGARPKSSSWWTARAGYLRSDHARPVSSRPGRTATALLPAHDADHGIDKIPARWPVGPRFSVHPVVELRRAKAVGGLELQPLVDIAPENLGAGRHQIGEQDRARRVGR